MRSQFYEYTGFWRSDSYLCWFCQLCESEKKEVQVRIEETTPDHVSRSRGKGKGGNVKGKCKGKVLTCYKCGEQGHLARECPALTGKGKGNNWLSPQQWTHYNPGIISKQRNYWRPGNSKGNSTQLLRNDWKVNQVNTCGEVNWPGRSA